MLTLFCIPMFVISSKELAPEEDQGVIFGIVDAPANQTVEENARYAEKANETYFGIPETDYTFQVTTPQGGFSGMILEPWGERDRTTFDLQPIVQERLGGISGLNVFPVAPEPLPGGAENFPMNFLILSTAEPDRILEFAETLRDKAATSGLFAFPPIIDTKIDQPRAEYTIDRDMVGSLGLDLRTVGADLSAMVGGGYVNRFNIEGRSYKVIPQIERSGRLNPDQLQDIYIAGPGGELITLSTVADMEQSVEPRSLNRFQQFNAVKLSGIAIRPLDVILIFLVLAAQFNSFRDPFVILLGSVPLAMFGALIFTSLQMNAPGVPFWTNGFTTTLNIYSQVGLVTLVGLVAKNGIIIVEFANALQREGRSKLQAIQEAAEIRLRPVLMTSVATVAGHFPLVLASGAGAEARNSIGLVIVGGMAIGTLFTLLFLPSIYLLVAKDKAAEPRPTEAATGAAETV